MPIVEVTYAPSVPDDRLVRLSQTLSHTVSLAVQCPEEPYDHPLRPGDVELRWRARGPFDTDGLDLVVEVRSTWFASRAETRQGRCDQLCAAIRAEAGSHTVGVFLSLPVAAWSQTD